MNNRSRAFVFACGVLMAATPALAQDYLDDDAFDGTAYRGPGTLVTNRINSRIVRTAPDGCRVTSTIRGTIRGREFGTSNFGGRYRPDLAVSTRVACPDGRAERTFGRVVGGRFNDLQLERAIESRGRVFLGHWDRSCNYAPDVEINDGSVILEGVNQTCSRARGGGPVYDYWND